MPTIKIRIKPSKILRSDIHYNHVGECKTDISARQVCEGMYADKVDIILELCAALRAVYAIAGEDPQIRIIVEKALEISGLES